jgi:SAM-dependent methyltransferase
MQNALGEVWASGSAYEPYIGRWSRLVARVFVEWLDAPLNSVWVDVGCGTGALTENILAIASPARVDACDPSPGFIQYAREQIHDPRAEMIVADARALPHEDASVDVAVSGLVLNFIPEPERALAELQRVVRQSGVIAMYVWDYAGKMQLMRYFWDSAMALDENAAALDEGNRFPICNPVALERLFRNAGLRDVQTRTVDISTPFRDFADYWTPFLAGEAPAPSYVASLSPERRALLREHVRANLPIAADGSIDLIARAWAIRGRRL